MADIQIFFSGSWTGLLAAIGSLILPAALAETKSMNGFDLSNLSVSREYVKSGGPPRDGIPAIDQPLFVAADKAGFLSPSDRVLGLSLEGVAKAYPIKILDRHEVVNDRFGDQPVAVTYCPLCGSGIAFDADVKGAKSFGVSGLLYNSDVLLYDRQTESLWSQIEMEAVSGPLQGTSLTPLPIEHTTWSAWNRKHPDSLVLSNEQGIYPPAAYETEVYSGYEKSDRTWFPVERKSKRLKQKAWVLGLTIDGQSKAYPLETLAEESSPIRDTVGGTDVRISYDAEARSAVATDAEGSALPATTLYWFAWYAFHPQTDIFGEQE